MTDALAEALATEHAAIYAYGSIGAMLEDEQADLARQAEAVHRQRRDTLVVLLAERDVTSPAAAAAYELPFPTDGQPEALELAVQVEDWIAAMWHAALPQVAHDDRELVLESLVDAALWATRWRDAAGMDPVTIPFPGRPELS